MLEIDRSEEFDGRFLVPLVLQVVILFAQLYQVVSQHWRQVLASLGLTPLVRPTVVHLHVVPQVGLLAEAPMTHLTPEGPGPRVHIHVALQVSGGREGFGTQQALVRLLLENQLLIYI